MKILLLKTLRNGCFAIICIVTLLALLVAEENFRGKIQWENYRREHETRGEHLDLQHFIPPPVPDDENFAMTPLLARLFEKDNAYRDQVKKALELTPGNGNAKRPSLGDRATGKRINLDDWQACFGGQDVLTALQKFDPQLTEISEAAKRPYSRFPIHYEKMFSAELLHFSVLMPVAQIYTLRALAELQAGQTDAAFADVQTEFRLAESLKSEPYLISFLVRISIFQTGLQAIWAGLADHRWSDAQLQALQGDLEKIDFIAGMLTSFRGERAGANTLLLQSIQNRKLLVETMQGFQAGNKNNFLRLIPSCVIYQNLLTINRNYDEGLSLSDPVSLLKFGTQDVARANASQNLSIGSFNPYKAIAKLVLPAFGCITKGVQAQVVADEATTACALERYRLANGRYPDTLDKLVPAYLKIVPRDVAGGGTLHYCLKDDGLFLLYSVGSNGKDDGGKVFLQPNGRIDPNQGDWVW